MAFTRDGSVAAELVPGAVLGTLFLLFALVRGGALLGLALWLAGATYVAGIVSARHAVDAIAPVVALGARAVHIPYAVTWNHEQLPEDALPPSGWYRLGAMDELAGLLETIDQASPRQV